MQKGEAASWVGVVLDGELEARGEGGVRLGAANVGSLAGEISLFQGGVRGAMMVSTQPGAAVRHGRRSDRSDKEVRSNTAPSIGSCASSGRAWRHLAARDTQGERPGHWAPSHCLRCSNQPPPEPPIPPPPLTTKVAAITFDELRTLYGSYPEIGMRLVRYTYSGPTYYGRDLPGDRHAPGAPVRASPP